MTHAIDLDAYFDRIRYVGPREPTLEVLGALLSAHVMTIPFENLDVVLERPIELSVEALEAKLVTSRRGGYCFEQNGFFLEVLAALGFAVTPLSARVRLGRTRDETPARTHLLVRVELDDGPWLADVGVGAASLTAPIRLVVDLEQETPHDRRRIQKEGDRYFHQLLQAGQWLDVYELTGEVMPLVDRVVGNWYTSTHPDSHFRKSLMMAKALPGGRRLTLLDREVTVRERDGRAEKRTLASLGELVTTLENDFGVGIPTGSTGLAETHARPSSLVARLLSFPP